MQQAQCLDCSVNMMAERASEPGMDLPDGLAR